MLEQGEGTTCFQCHRIKSTGIGTTLPNTCAATLPCVRLYESKLPHAVVGVRNKVCDDLPHSHWTAHCLKKLAQSRILWSLLWS